MTGQRSFARFAWGVLAYNIFVVVWGAFVRATGSGAGCGNHWPMCNGQVVPRAPQLATLIEFAHRATSGIDLIAIVILVVWAFRAYPKGHRVRLGAALSGFFIVTEALIGAGLVLFEHVAKNASTARAFSLSIHLMNTFTLLAVLALTAWWASGGAPISPRPAHQGLLVAALAGLVVLGISGAITALGDTLFPVTSLSAGFSQDFSPTAHLFVRLRVFHPGIAIAATVFLLFAVGRVMKQSPGQGTQKLGLAVMALAFIQLMIGALNLALLAPVSMQLVHLALGDFLWIATVLFTAEAWSRS
ncbi:MAG: COX15/CtaA family protein [Acidobacteria bacterium]|nr:COX15/CtaA family protein [Acidobacteriota bacterium]